ncbi:PLD nuclease N-terminal domain-containing protein [Methanolobus sp. WCC4]|uniref:PLD nuclease N-terminal domain-containing protein n=1 Tax=Methanolobus sp. WCC4 TaxID=3125784 RepID=UPI0030F8F00A
MLEEILIGIPILMFLFFFGAGILGTLFWIWMLIDCATREPSEGNDKLIWIIVIIFTHLLGALIYFLVRRPKRIEMYGR